MSADNLFTTCVPAVENLFRHLNARELSRCAQVCKVWHSISVTEWKRRQHLDWFLQKGCPPVDGLHPFQEKMKNSRMRPSVCFTFLSPFAVRDLRPITQPTRKRVKRHDGNYSATIERVCATVLRPVLPSDCELHIIPHKNVIGCHDDLSPIELEKGSNVAGILIPKYPGVDISHVHIDQWPEAREGGELLKGPIKCLLVVDNTQMTELNEHSMPAELIQDCYRSQGERFALGGGFVKNCNSAFIFRGENVEAASIVLDNTMKGPAIAEEMKLFLKTGLLENAECFCFVFNCIARGSKLFKAKNYQSDIFHSIYPKVPLLGSYAYGEFGAFHLPNVDPEEKWYKERAEVFNFENCARGFSTVYVLISIKKPKK